MILFFSSLTGIQHQAFQTASVNPTPLMTTQPQALNPLASLDFSGGAHSSSALLPAVKLLMSQQGCISAQSAPLRRAGMKRRLDGLSSGVFVARDGSIKPLHCTVGINCFNIITCINTVFTARHSSQFAP